MERDLIRLEGGRGTDILFGDEESELLVGRHGADLLLGGGGNDILRGGGGADQLFGDFGDDILSGGNGKDFLSGGFGSDILIGGRGEDVFVVDIPLFFDFWPPFGEGEILNAREVIDGEPMPIFGPDFGTDVIVDFTGEDQLLFNLPEGFFGFDIFAFLDFVQDGDDVVILFNPGFMVDEGEGSISIELSPLEVIEEEPAGPPVDDGLPSDFEGPIGYELVRLLNTDLETLFGTEPLFGVVEFGFPVGEPDLL